MTIIALATEDDLSEAVGLNLVTEMLPCHQVQPRLRQRGSGYLRANLEKFARLAERQPVLLLTDLDLIECPATLVRKWRGRRTIPSNLLFRVAVREIESWLLADHEALTELLGRAAPALPSNPDALQDPKQFLLRLANKAPRRLRDGLVRKSRGKLLQGIEYNTLLSEFVRTQWSPTRAAIRSESLRRARARIEELAARL